MTRKSGPDGGGPAAAQQPYWQRKTLSEMTVEEWEQLCDGCAKCCLIKLVDDDTEELVYTSVVCRLLDQDQCKCTDYANRTTRVPTCIKLTPRNLEDIDWMPSTCAYRLLADGQDLPDWHPLISENKNSVHEAGMSVRGKIISEEGIADADLEDYAVTWPNP